MMRHCKEIRENLALFSDGELTPAEREAVAAHLDSCLDCQRAAAAFAHLKNEMKDIRLATSAASPPTQIWHNATIAWNRIDMRRRRRWQLRMAFAGACLLLFTLGVSWARLFSNGDFPVTTAVRDFQTLSATSSPEFQTHDWDKAALWLRMRLGAEISPYNLTLSGAELLGADLVTDKPALGRLLFRTSKGYIALYICPQHRYFPEAKPKTLQGRSFFSLAPAERTSLLGWVDEKTGICALSRQDEKSLTDYAIDARRVSERKP